MKVFNIEPVPKPRMTQADKWKKRPPVLKYFAFKDEVKLNKITLPESHYHIIFILPMPKSWSKTKRSEMNGKPHQQIKIISKKHYLMLFLTMIHVYGMGG